MLLLLLLLLLPYASYLASRTCSESITQSVAVNLVSHSMFLSVS
jgi:hypothetical protein